MHVEEGVDHVGCKQSSISILKKSLNIVGFSYILYNMTIQYTYYIYDRTHSAYVPHKYKAFLFHTGNGSFS
jgi:hypothetical protein